MPQHVPHEQGLTETSRPLNDKALLFRELGEKVVASVNGITVFDAGGNLVRFEIYGVMAIDECLKL
ncbi:hypothetical protein [Sinorhizobium medicae]|nr:hypothetical protein [Sinorhizobium medicae]